MRGFAEFFRLTEMADWAEFQQTPPELAFLHGDVDLGFENLRHLVSPRHKFETSCLAVVADE
jgi:hypothetical protein